MSRAADVHGVPEGAPAPVFAKDRDLDATRGVLEPWLAARLGVAEVSVGAFTFPAGAGVSNETLLFAATWHADARRCSRDLVLRIHPSPESQIFLEPEFRAQFDVLDVLHRRSLVRVAEALWFEGDESLLGRPFFVMEQLHGMVPVSMPVYNASGFLFDASPSQRRRLWLSSMDQLTRVANVPVEAVSFLDRPAWGTSGLAQHLDYWDRSLTWTLGDDVPDILVEIREWLAAHQPRPDTGLAWGDARIGNVMYGADFEVVGVMDWEQVSLGGPLLDLGWWLLFDDYHSVDHGLVRLDGLGTRQETIDYWEDRTGRSAADLHWYEVYAGWKLAVIVMRTMNLGVTEGKLRRTTKNVFLARTCTLLDRECPSEFG